MLPPENANSVKFVVVESANFSLDVTILVNAGVADEVSLIDNEPVVSSIVSTVLPMLSEFCDI